MNIRRVRGGPGSFPSGLELKVLERLPETEKQLDLDFAGIVEDKEFGQELHLHKNGSDIIIYIRDGKLTVAEHCCMDIDQWGYDIYDDDGNPVAKR